MQFRPPQHPARVAIVGGGLLLASTLTILAGAATDTAPTTANRPAAIEAQYPEPGAVIRAQETVGVDLRDDLTGVIVIDGNRMPEDQYSGDPNLGLIQFRPGTGQEFREFEPGDHEVRIEYWPADLTEEQARAQRKVAAHAWRFKVS